MFDQIQPMNYQDLFMAQNLGLGQQIPQPMSGVQPPVAQPQNPEINHLNDVIKQYTQSKQQQSDNTGTVQNILSQRFQPEAVAQSFQPTLADTSSSIFQSNQDSKYTSPEEMAAKRAVLELSPYTTAMGLQEKQAEIALKNAQAKFYGQGGAPGMGGATGVLVNKVMADNPGMSFTDALYAVQTGWRQGTSLGANGSIMPLSGAPEAKGALKFGEQSGSEQAKQQYAAEIERQKKIGEGAITDVQKKETGQRGVATTVNTLEDLYNQLDRAGAAVSTTNTPQQNLSAKMRGSMAGQLLGKTVGTPEQSIRNQIAMQIPNLINDIRQATGMSARAMDSNTELQFYLKMATDPTADIQANRKALETIKQKYLSGFQGEMPSAPANGVTHRFNPSTGQLEEVQ